ncbi:MAG: MFS transporter [Caulobacteraceae bacterium]
MARSEPMEIVDIIESRKVTPSLVLLVALCFVVVCFDGFNAQVMGYVIPSLAKAWHMKPKAIPHVMGPITSAGLFGLMIGALLLGTLGDRVGRKSIVLVSTLLFGVFSLATSFATSPGEMTVLRFLTGLGLGGAMPSVIALVSEFVSKRIRATVVTMVVTGFAVGPAVGGLLAGPLMHSYGWSVMFLVGGVVPLLVAPLLWLVLPESSRFLSRSNAPAAKIVANLRRVYPELKFPDDVQFDHADGRLPKAAVRDIFADGRAPGTLLMWFAIFLNLVGLNLQTSWLPTIITGLGFPYSVAITTLVMFHTGGALGGFVLSRFLDQFDHFRVVAVTFILAGLMIVLIGFAPHSILMLRLAIFGAGLFVVGGQSALNALTGLFYPSHIRSTGSGWALGVGRLGAAVGPMVGSSLLAMNLGFKNLFYVEAAPFILAAVAVGLIGMVRSGRRAAAVPAVATPARASTLKG